VKIAAIEHRSSVKIDRDDTSYIGFELGADIHPAINLDDYLVFDNNEARAVEFFKNLISNHCATISKTLELDIGYTPPNPTSDRACGTSGPRSVRSGPSAKGSREKFSKNKNAKRKIGSHSLRDQNRGSRLGGCFPVGGGGGIRFRDEAALDPPPDQRRSGAVANGSLGKKSKKKAGRLRKILP
jgi:hypothetical protein